MTFPLPSFTRFLLRAVSLLVLLLSASLLTQGQTIRYVKPAATGNGSSWANASGNLQATINASSANDQVWVAAGTYKPTTGTDRTISFSMKNGVAIYGGFAGNETALNQRMLSNPLTTTLSGDIGTAGNNADNSYHVINNPVDLNNTAVLDGFLITAGNANGSTSPNNAGGGMNNNDINGASGAYPTVRNCSFQANSATNGGAIYNYNGLYGTSNPVLTNCSFQGNSATNGGAFYNFGDIKSSKPVLTNCSFQGNSATNGGAFYNDGSYNAGYSRPVLTNCVLFGNGGSNSIVNRQGNTQASSVEARYSLFEAGATGFYIIIGNSFNLTGITINPFASTATVALNACAPAINSGSNAAYTTANGPGTDLAGNTRFFPGGGQIDMGAIEFQTAPQSITVTSPSVSSATVGTAFNQPFSASGGSVPYGYSLSTGSLPPGLSLSTTGVLSGIPTQVGNFTFTVRVQDPNGCSGVSAAYVLSVRSNRPIRYVKVGGTGSGNSWADASGDLQSQIDFIGAEQVWVAAGTYKPTTGTDRTIHFTMRPNVAIYGGFVGNETALSARPALNPVLGNASSTTLSGDIGVVGTNADNSYNVIRNSDGLTTTAILDGFVITSGNANGNIQSDYGQGGGMLNASQFGIVNPLIRNCSFVANSSANNGGAINNYTEYADGPYTRSCSPTLINCLFQSNSAAGRGGAVNSASSGAFRSDPQFTNCVFISNTAHFGGALYNSGSGNYGNGNIGYCQPRLTNCSFQANSAIDGYGGAIYNAGNNGGQCYPTLINCSFQSNSAIGTLSSPSFGGAIMNDGRGGQLLATLVNCSFQNNDAMRGGAISGFGYQGQSVVEMTNSVVFGNGGANTFDNDGLRAPIYADNSLLDASVTNYQNRGANIKATTSPFASPTSTPLAATSPAINAGNPGTTTATVGETDVAGNPRVVGCRVDMGAYEFQYVVLPVAITAQPATSSVVCTGSAITVPVSVSGSRVVGYQWYKDSFANPVSGQTSATLTLSNAQSGNAGSYSLVVTGSCNSVTTTAFNLTVNSLPTVSISPGSVSICPGQSALLTATGASTYTWSDNTTGNTLSTTTAGTYSVTGVDGDGNGCANTATASVTVNNPTVSISPGSVSICQGQLALLTASGASTYTWSNNTTGNTLSATTAGTYSVTGVDGIGCSSTATASVTVNSLPSLTITASPSATVTQGASITLTLSNTEAASFTWVTGSTSSSIVINPATSAPYSVTARNGAGCVAVASLDITVTPIVCGPVIYVTQLGSGQRDGSSWDNALGSSQLQLGINAAADCGGNGQVWVAAGLYKPTTGNDRNASFAMRPNVAIYGGFVGNETALTDRPALNPVADRPSSTTFSGDIGTVGNTSDNTFNVIRNPVGLTTTAVLDGFVITGGAGGTLGGGMFNDGSSPTLRNCSFVGNSVSASGSTLSRGGAIYNGNSSSPQLANCFFLNNSASSSGFFSGFGGAIANLNSSNPILTNCNFVNNQVSGSATNQGGAIANNLNSNPQLTNCSFLSNSASGGTTSRGGAMANANGSNPQLTNCNFLNNSVSGGTDNQGGAVFNGASSPQLTNCVLFGNGGANTFYSTFGGGSVVAYSLLEATVTSFTAGANNLTTSTSPFVSPTDVRLNGCSPAINAGDNAANATATDPDGNPRVFNGGRIDMGAYEYQGAAGIITTAPSVSTATLSVAFSQPFTASGGTSPYTYSVASGSLPSGLGLSNTGVLSGTPTQAGSFTLTVLGRDATGCSGVSAAYVLTVNNAANPSPTLAGFTASPGAVCAGSGVSFTATVGNLTGSYSYTLTNGLTGSLTGSASGSPFSQSITASGPQNFTLTVSANGQSASSTTTLTVNPLPVATLASSGTLSCAQSSVTLTAGGGSSYTFASGSGVLGTPGPVNTVVVSTSGTYSVTVADASGCVSTTSTSVTADQTVPSISITPSSATLTCTSPTVSLSAIGNGSVRWSKGETTPVISVSAAGPYSVTATGGNGCSAVASASVSQDNTVPVANLTNNGPLSCTTTSVTLTASGGSAYRFSNGANQIGNGPTATVTTAGFYSVTVVSSNGCTATASTTVVGDQSVPEASLTSNGPISCSTTSVTLTASGGGTYRFSPGANQVGNGPTATVSSPGVYSVTVVSSYGCSAVASVSVSQDNTAPTATLTGDGPLTCSLTTVTLTAGGGSRYVFSSGATPVGSANTATVTTAGVYSVTVTADNDCSSVASVSVTQDNTAPVATISANSSTTLTCTHTQVALFASGGNRYVFSGPGIVSQEGSQALVNVAGVYSVTVTNSNTGCFSVTSITISQDNTAPQASLASSGTLSCTVSSVTLTASPGGLSYAFSGPGVVSQSDNQALVNASGLYSVTVSNGASGCSSVASVSVSQETTNPVATISASPSTTLTCTQTSLTLTAGGGNGYNFSGPGVASQSGNTAVVNAAGVYSVIVTNTTTGCSSTTSISISRDAGTPIATLSASPSTTLTCSQTSLTLTASGGNAYSFSPNVASQSSNQAIVNASGTYSVTVSNTASGCSSTTSITISQDNTAPSASLASSGPLSCAVTSVTLTANPNGQNYRFSAGASQIGSSNQATVSTPGLYSVTVINGGNGCTGVASVSVSQDNTAPVATLSASPSTTLTCLQTSLTLTADGGNAYAFKGPGVVNLNGNQAVVNAAGVYSVTVSNASGCTATASTSVTVNPPPAAPTLTGVSRTVSASNTPLPLGQFVSAPGTLSFSGVSGAIANPPTANVSTGGVQTFRVTQTDANGCTSGATPFSITVLPPTPGDQTVCRSSLVVLTAITTGVRYEWYKNGQSAPFKLTEIASIQKGTATSSLTIVSIQTTASYYCKVFQANGTFTFDGPLKVTVDYSCIAPGARIAATEVAEVPLSITLTPNPVVDGQLRAVVRGAGDASLSVELLDLRGQVVRSQHWPAAAGEQVIDWNIAAQPAGLYLLQAQASGQRSTTKVIHR